MAKKRMFSLDVVDTDDFLEMPCAAQALYFHLGMHGDDDGFVANPRKITRTIGCTSADMQALISKGFVIPFESGVIAIRDWRINNDLKNDRYRPSLYTEEKEALLLDDSKRYILDTYCFQSGSDLETEHNVAQPNVT